MSENLVGEYESQQADLDRRMQQAIEEFERTVPPADREVFRIIAGIQDEFAKAGEDPRCSLGALAMASQKAKESE